MADWFDKIKAEDITDSDVESPHRTEDDYPVRMVINCRMGQIDDEAYHNCMNVLRRVFYVLSTSHLIKEWEVVKLNCADRALSEISAEFNIGYVVHENLYHRLEMMIYLIPDQTEYSVQDMVRVMQFTNKICRIIADPGNYFANKDFKKLYYDAYFAYIRRGFNQNLPMTINIPALLSSGTFSTLDLSDILVAFNVFTKVKSSNELFDELQLRFKFSSELAMLYVPKKDEYQFPCTIETWDDSDPLECKPVNIQYMIRGKNPKQLGYHYFIINNVATFCQSFYLSCYPPGKLKILELFEATEPKDDDKKQAVWYMDCFTNNINLMKQANIPSLGLAERMCYEFDRMMDCNIKYQSAIDAAKEYVNKEKEEEQNFFKKRMWL